MYRASLIAFLSLCLSVGLVAKEPQSELEAIAVSIMTKAFQVADYDTVETLFGKLSPENKVKFLQEAEAMTLTDTTNMVGKPTISDSMLVATMQAQPDNLLEVLERWAEAKQEQTQLLGRLTLSLFESATEEKQSLPNTVIPAQAGIQTKDVHTAPLGPRLRGGDGKNLYQPVYTAVHIPPSVAPPDMAPFAPPGHEDGFITLNSYGRLYIKGLNAGEIIDAVNFHLSRFVEQPRVAARHSLSVEMRSLDDAHSDEQIDGEWWRGSVPLNIFR